jgi:hypothetical protein
VRAVASSLRVAQAEDLFMDVSTQGATATAVAPAAELTLSRIQDYVWKRYVKFDSAAGQVDEDQALALFARHYETQPMSADAECFYFGILAYERSFGQTPPRQRRYLRQALDAFQAYRRQTSDGFAWDAVEDRYAHLVDELWPQLEAAAGSALD